VRARRAAAVVVLVVVGAAGCSSSGATSTPEEAFVAEVREAGIFPADTDADLLENSPCVWLEGEDVLGVVDVLAAQDGDPDPKFFQAFLVYGDAATKHLCPEARATWLAAVDLYADGEFSAP